MVEATLDAMANGGMYDQVGGASTGTRPTPGGTSPLREDALRQRPPRLALRPGLAGDRLDRYRRVATETLDYLLRELRHPDGAFFLAADLEGVEGSSSCGRGSSLVRRGPAPRRARRRAPRPARGGRPGREGPARGGGQLPGRPPRRELGTNVCGPPDRSPRRQRRTTLTRRDGGPSTTPGMCCSGSGTSGFGRPPTTRCSPWGTAWRSAVRRGGKGIAGAGYVAAAGAAADFVLTRLRRPDARLLRSRRGRGDEPGLPTTTPHGDEAGQRCTRRRSTCGGSATRGGWPTTCSACSAIRNVAGSPDRVGRSGAGGPAEGAVRPRRPDRERLGRPRPPAPLPLDRGTRVPVGRAVRPSAGPDLMPEPRPGPASCARWTCTCPRFARWRSSATRPTRPRAR